MGNLSWENRWQLERQERENYERILLATLRKAGIKTVRARFDGSGDSGSVDYVSGVPDQLLRSALKPAKTKAEAVVSGLEHWGEREKTLMDALCDYVEHRLENTHPGWELNAGSYGDMLLYVDTGKVEFSHTYRHEDDEDEYSDGG